MSNIQVASCPQCHSKKLRLLRQAFLGFWEWAWDCPTCGWVTKWNVMFADMRELAEWGPFGADPDLAGHLDPSMEEQAHG